MDAFWLCFVPLFVAVDAIGLLPFYVSMTEGIERHRVAAIVLQSIVTASAVVLVFVIFGPSLLSFLGITVSDFMIAGGLLLFAISLSDILAGEKRISEPDIATVGAVPLGVPLIAGPAVLTTSVLLSTQHGRPVTAAAALLNVLLAGLFFQVAHPLAQRLGLAGTRTISKIASLLLASIAVMLVRKGIAGVAG